VSRYATQWSLSVASLGVGIVVGSTAGPAAYWGGLVVMFVGLAVFLLRPRRPVPLGAPRQPPGTGTPIGVDTRPTMSGLGTRVAGILLLAEQQAEQHLSAARREAREIVERARAEAAATRAGTPLPTGPAANRHLGSPPTAP
jgi:uncharacterized oligopeptide transporter (OPT) family protein